MINSDLRRSVGSILDLKKNSTSSPLYFTVPKKAASDLTVLCHHDHYTQDIDILQYASDTFDMPTKLYNIPIDQ